MTSTLQRLIQATTNFISGDSPEGYRLSPEAADDICSIDRSASQETIDKQFFQCAQDLRRYENFAPARSILHSLISHPLNQDHRQTALDAYRDSLGWDVWDKAYEEVVQEASQGTGALDPLNFGNNLSDEEEAAQFSDSVRFGAIASLLGPLPAWYISRRLDLGNQDRYLNQVLNIDRSFDHTLLSPGRQAAETVVGSLLHLLGSRVGGDAPLE